MKIEKVDDNTFKCIIDKQELTSHHLNVDDMTYGAENTTELFLEMLNKANIELGFTFNKSLAIEAIPLREGGIELFVSKIESPDELDMRFSKFSPSKQFANFPSFFEMLEGAFDKLEDELKNQNMQGLQDIRKDANSKVDMRKEDAYISIFSFESIDRVSEGSKRINNVDFDSTLYKDEKSKRYLLVLKIDKNVEKDQLDNFNKVCNVLAEYGEKVQGMGYNLAYYKEHFQTIIQDNVVQKLANI